MNAEFHPCELFGLFQLKKYASNREVIAFLLLPLPEFGLRSPGSPDVALESVLPNPVL